MDKLRYYRLSGEEKRIVLEKIRRVLLSEGVRLGIVFGSFVDMDCFRDIDIAIYINGREELDKILGIGVRLEEELGIPVDIVPLQSVSPTFRLKILRDGIIVVEEPGIFEALLQQALDELTIMKFEEISLKEHG